MIATFNQYHLGDNLVHLHFMRKLAQKHPDKQFEHYVSAQHIPQLAPLAFDVANLHVKELDGQIPGAINAWRGAEGFWHNHGQRSDFVMFHFDWFEHLAKQMGLVSPILTEADLRFDYPALAPTHPDQHFENPKFDVLVINSIPHSGQFGQFNPHDMVRMVQTLLDKGKTVITTAPTGTEAKSTHDGSTGLSVTGIGRLSLAAHAIVGVVTGPSWTTMNVWNTEKQFIHLLDYETVNVMPNTKHVRSCAEAMQFL